MERSKPENKELPASWKVFVKKRELEEMKFNSAKSVFFAKENGIDYLGLRLYQFFQNAIGASSFSLSLEDALSMGLIIKLSIIEEEEKKEFYKQQIK